jgi:Tfp pilus assembly protein PilN
MITINLLPGAAKRKRRQELIKILSIAFSMFGLTLIGLGLVISVVFSQKALTENDINNIDKQITARETELAAYEPVINQTRLLKEKLVVINEVLGSTNYWSDFLDSLAKSTPANGVKFVSLNVDESLEMSISGVADDSVRLAVMLKAMREAYKPLDYFVQPKDTLERIAKQYDVEPAQILEVNDSNDGAELLGRDKIVVPQKLFKNVDFSSVSLQSDDTVPLEVQKNVIFSLDVEVNQESIR